MFYKKMAGTDLTVSAIAMGSALFDATYSEDFAFDQLDIFAENGGNFIDTAHVYNDWIPGEKSRSEKLLGRWLSLRGMQNKMVVVTKGAHPPMTDMAHSRVTYDDIRRDVIESLDFLQKSQIDLYLLHRDDTNIPVDEIVCWMNELIDKHFIRYWGCSNWTIERIIAANAYASAHGLAGMRCNQTMWSFASINPSGLNDPSLVPLDRATYDYHCASGLNLMAFTAQAKGYFARLDLGKALSRDIDAVYGIPANAHKFELLKQMCLHTGLTLSELSLIFFWKHPFTAIPVVSYSNREQLKAGLRAYRPEIKHLLDKLDFPLEF